MFDFGNANDAQKLAISSSNGAVLITAGPPNVEKTNTTNIFFVSGLFGIITTPHD